MLIQTTIEFIDPKNKLKYKNEVLAWLESDYNKVKNNPNQYKNFIKYFQIDLDEDGKLHQPILTKFHYEGYVGVYFNKKLITAGKAKHLFSNAHQMCSTHMNFCRINLEPVKK